MNSRESIRLLRREMVPALGVTEPAAIALACARAYAEVKGDLESIEIVLDPGVFKNAFSCAVPGTNEKGIEIAALLGALGGDPQQGLETLKSITQAQIFTAKELRDRGLVKIEIADLLETGVHIEALVRTTTGTGKTVILGTHDNIVRTEADGRVTFENPAVTRQEETLDITQYKVADFVGFVEEVPFSHIDFVLEAIAMNEELMQAGSQGEGMHLGRGMQVLITAGKIGSDLRSYAELLTACAVDARMGGLPLPAMSICGSGDHGIIATIPLLAVAQLDEIDNEKLARGIALSYLITIYIKAFSGRLSAFCGCAVAAGAGACAGITYLLGGNTEQIGSAINTMAANLTGIICDGGNFGCSLKAVNGAGTAVLASLLALEGVAIPMLNGIVGETVEETMQNMGSIASPGMTKTNEIIIDIMRRKRCCGA